MVRARLAILTPVRTAPTTRHTIAKPANRYVRFATKDQGLTDQSNVEFSIETVFGRKLRVARWRWNVESEHLPVLFFNGIGTNIEAVSDLAEALDDRPFMIFDMPGVGLSPEPLVPYNTAMMSLTARELLRRFNCEQADVMGVSWGGALAQQFALQHSDCVRRLVLCATSAGMVPHPSNLRAILRLGKAGRIADAGFLSRNFASIYTRVADRRKELTAHLMPPTLRGFGYQLLAMWGWTSLPALPLLAHETLIMMGEDDEIVPLANGRILAAMIPRSRLEVFAGGGHLFMLTHSEQTVSSLRAFLDEPERKSAYCPPNRKAA